MLREMLGYGSREADVADSVLSDVDPEEVSAKELTSAIDQKSEEAGVDPVDVAQKMAEENPEVDQKVLGRIRERIRSWLRDPESFEDREQVRDALDSLSGGPLDNETIEEAKEQAAAGNIDRARQIILNDPGALEALGLGEMVGTGDVGLFADVDQNMDQKNEDNEDEEENSTLDMLAEDARSTVEDYAELVGKDPEDCVEEVLTGGGGYEDTTAPVDENYDDKGGHDEKSFVTEEELDQKLQEQRDAVVDAVTDEEVVGQIAQKMASDEDFQDEIVETVDQKGDFATTPNPNNDVNESGKTVADVGLGGGDD